jgi:tetratricopeptide (TPR) repeat protein
LYNNIAWTNVVYFREDLLEEADDYSNKALSSSPKFSVFLGTRGAVLIRKGEVREGIELLKKAFRHHSENAARSAEGLFIGIGEAKLGNKKEALARLEQARKIHSNQHFFSIAEKEIIETINLTNKND